MPIPFWLSNVTIELLGSNVYDELKSERETLIQRRMASVEQENRFKEIKNSLDQPRLKVIGKWKPNNDKKGEERKVLIINMYPPNDKKGEERKVDLEIGQLYPPNDKKGEERKNFKEKIEKPRNKFFKIWKPSNEKEEAEFISLVAEFEGKGYTKSAQVSKYIVENRLGNKYQNISGVLEMTKNGETWDFHGGFPPNVYAALCRCLNLGNNESGAKPGKFVPFKDLNNKY